MHYPAHALVVMALLVMALLLASGAACAQSPGIQGPLPAGVPVTPVAESWLLPAPYYDRCLASALDVRVYSAKLKECVAVAETGTARTEQTLTQARADVERATAALRSIETDLKDAQQATEALHRRLARTQRTRDLALAALVGATAGVLAVRYTPAPP